MKKSIRRVLGVMGCAILSSAIILSSGCSVVAKKTRTTRDSGETKEPTETSETDDTTDTSDTSDTSDTKETSDPSNTDDTTATTSKADPDSDAAKKLHDLDERLFKESMKDIIDMEYTLDHPENMGLSWPEQGFECWSEEDEKKEEEENLDIKAELEAIDYDSLGLEDKMLYDTIMYDVEMSEKGSKYKLHYTSALNSLTGVNAELPVLFATMTIEDVESAERYIKMVNDTYDYLASLLKYEEKRAEEGTILPDTYLENLVDSCVAVYKDHDGNYLYTTFDEKINALDCDDATKKDLIAKNKEALDNKFFPAYEMLAEGVKKLYGKAKTSGSLCEMEGGKEFYEYYFQLRSGTSMTVPEAIEYLDKKIKDTMNEMNTMIYSFSQDDIAELSKYLTGNKMPEYTTGSFEKDIEFCQDAIKSDFPELPKHEYYTYHIPKELSENFSPAAYMSTQIDNPNHNMLMLNDKSSGLGDMLTTVAHEAYPGHLFEFVYHLNLNNYYQKIGGTTAYKEGWSTYSENYIMKLTDYNYNVYRFFYLNKIVTNYYMHARIDIGIHYEGWSYEDTMKYVKQYFPDAASSKEMTDFFYDMDVEIPCYITPYCFGNINCTKIINDAVEQFGDQYSMKQIHAAYLDMGPSSFDLLAKYMPEYVKKQS